MLVVVVVGVSVAMMPTTSALTWAATAEASPVVGQAPPAFASAFAHAAPNWASQRLTSTALPFFSAFACAFRRQRS